VVDEVAVELCRLGGEQLGDRAVGAGQGIVDRVGAQAQLRTGELGERVVVEVALVEREDRLVEPEPQPGDAGVLLVEPCEQLCVRRGTVAAAERRAQEAADHAADPASSACH